MKQIVFLAVVLAFASGQLDIEYYQPRHVHLSYGGMYVVPGHAQFIFN